MIIAEIGPIPNVSGRSTAVAVVGPSPGNTPTSIPIVTPIRQYNRLDHDIAVSKPDNNRLNDSIQIPYHPNEFTGNGILSKL
jgi:hypothetical protein